MYSRGGYVYPPDGEGSKVWIHMSGCMYSDCLLMYSVVSLPDPGIHAGYIKDTWLHQDTSGYSFIDPPPLVIEPPLYPVGSARAPRVEQRTFRGARLSRTHCSVAA